VLFAHGWISSRRMWYDVVERLDEDRFTMHLLDFRGCGDADRPAEGHDLQGYAGDLRDALALIPQPVVLVGHSMGGKLAQLIASEHPSNLDRLILVAPGTAKAARFSQRHRDMTVAAYGSKERVEAFQRAAMVADVPQASIDRIIEDALACQYEHWIGWYDRGRTIDFYDRVGSINVPTLVVAGEKDPLAPASLVRKFVARAIPGALYVQLRKARHNLPIEAPEEIADAVRQFGR
jgi:pimeloyl-ACP methyl ester carboxylesterase